MKKNSNSNNNNIPSDGASTLFRDKLVNLSRTINKQAIPLSKRGVELKFSIRSFICFILVFTIILTGFALPVFSEDKIDNPFENGGDVPTTVIALKEFALAAQNSQTRLFYEDGTGAFYVEDIQTGTKFYSYPLDIAEQADMELNEALNTKSAIILKALQGSLIKSEIITIRSFTDCIEQGGMSIEKFENGLLYNYNFKEFGLVIPIVIKLENNKLTATIKTKEIKETGNYKIIDITVLPYFFAGTKTENGYLFVPDGSGAIINFNEKRNLGLPAYNVKVYGENLTSTIYSNQIKQQKVRLPVFGIKKENSALTAVISQGSADATIIGAPRSIINAYNGVFSTFAVRSKDVYLFVNENKVDIDVFQRTPLGDNTIALTYTFIAKENPTYSDMATAYREYLVSKGMLNLTPGNMKPYFYIDIYGATVRTKPFLGIPVEQKETLTTFKQAEGILNEIKALGINDVIVRYVNWSNNTIEKKMMTANTPASILGGKSGFEELLETARNNGYRIYADGNPIKVYSGNNLFSYFFDFAQTIRNSTAVIFDYKLSTKVREENGKKSFLIKASSIKDIFDKFGKSITKYPLCGISITGTDLPYTDFRKKDAIMENTKSLISQSLTDISKQGYMVQGGNDYALIGAEHIIATPQSSSGFDIQSDSIPFYQIAVHGLANYTLNAINSSPTAVDTYLKAVETGSSLYFTFMYAKGDKVGKSYNKDIYYANYSAWLTDASSMYKAYNETLSKIYNKKIVFHERLQDNVYKTVYENGIYTIVNYNNTDVMIDNIKIGAKAFVTEGGLNS